MCECVCICLLVCVCVSVCVCVCVSMYESVYMVCGVAWHGVACMCVHVSVIQSYIHTLQMFVIVSPTVSVTWSHELG